MFVCHSVLPRITLFLYIWLSRQILWREHKCGSAYLAHLINTHLTGPCIEVRVGREEGCGVRFTVYQVTSPVVKQCERKSVLLWWVSTVHSRQELIQSLLYVAHRWLILGRMSRVVQVALQINISHVSVPMFLKSEPTECKHNSPT